MQEHICDMSLGSRARCQLGWLLCSTCSAKYYVTPQRTAAFAAVCYGPSLTQYHWHQHTGNAFQPCYSVRINSLPPSFAAAAVVTEGQAVARSAALLSSCSRLTPELAQAAAESDTLLLVAADWAMFELFGVNWLSHVQRAGMDNYLIAALDQVGEGSSEGAGDCFETVSRCIIINC